MYIVYICEYNQWSIVSGIERAPVALSWSVHVQFTATRKHCSKKKCTCVVHRGFPNDWLATSSSDRNLQVKIPGENPRWVFFFSHGMLEFHGFRSLLIRLTYARVQVIDTCTCIHPCIESSFRKHMLPTSSAKGIWFPFFIALKMHFYEKYWHCYTI